MSDYFGRAEDYQGNELKHCHVVNEIVNLIDFIFPIGTVITNSNADFDPNIVYSGTTWKRIKGKVIIGVDESDTDFNSSDIIGGEKFHALTINEMPIHSHSASGGTAGSHSHTGSAASAGAHTHTVSGSAVSAGSHGHTASSGSAGGHYHNLFANAPASGQSPTQGSLTSSGSVSRYAGSGTSNMPYSLRVGSTSATLGLSSSNGAHAHSISVASNGAHTHSVSGSAGSNGAHTHSVSVGASGEHSHDITVGNAGSGSSHNNMQPYITKYIWQRIS